MKTILVVDDEWVIASVIELVLGDAGYRVVSAANGRAALERMSEAIPDLILFDYMMPVMNGAALLRALMASPEYKDIPRILMSSLPRSAVEQEIRACQGYLHKPFRDDELLASIAAALG